MLIARRHRVPQSERSFGYGMSVIAAGPILLAAMSVEHDDGSARVERARRDL